MKISNLCVYRCKEVPKDEKFVDAINADASRAFHPCGQTEPMRVGFVPVIGENLAPVFDYGVQSYALMMREQRRILPAYVVNEEVQERIKRIESAEARKVGKKEAARLKDEVYFSLLPRAFTRTDDTLILLYPDQQMVLVGASSLKKAEIALNLMRLTFGSLPVSRPTFKLDIEATMRGKMFDSERIAGFDITDRAIDLVSDDSVIRARGVAHDCDSILSALSDSDIKRLSLSFQDAVSFNLLSDCRLTSLKMSERLKGELASQNAEDHLAEQEAELFLWAATLGGMIPALLTGLGEVSQ